MMVPSAALYTGRVVHKRVRPVAHELDYRVFSLFLDIDDIDGDVAKSRLLARNRFAPLAFHDRDHGPRDGGPLRPWVEAKLREKGLDLGGGPIRLLCFPRMWGYVFNPLSVYFCYDPNGALRAVLYEVSNTFGEWHGYLLPVAAGTSADGPPPDGPPFEQEADKVFHVSPFLPVEGRYRFRLRPPGEGLSMLIRFIDGNGQDVLTASHTGQRKPLTAGSLLSALLAHPFMTWKVIAAIHWEALRLWLKGVAVFPKPARPESDVT